MTSKIEPARILIVEDESLVADDLEQRLRRLGYGPVGIVDTGEESVAKAVELRPDLVLMDIRLKGRMDGIEAAAKLQGLHRLPVVFLTAHSDKGTLERAGLSEPFGYLTKPFQERDLHATIEMALYRHRAEERLYKLERWLATTLRSIGDGVIAIDAEGKVTFMNPVAEELTGYEAPDSLGRDLSSIFLTYDPGTLRTVESPVVTALKHGEIVQLERDKTLIGFGGMQRPIDDSCAPIRDEHGRVVGGILVFRDVSERKQRENEREALIAELQRALANVKTLSGLLPVCAWCKKIRDDRGYWQTVETYLKAHSEAELTHSICPKCAEKQKVRA